MSFKKESSLNKQVCTIAAQLEIMDLFVNQCAASDETKINTLSYTLTAANAELKKLVEIVRDLKIS